MNFKAFPFMILIAIGLARLIYAFLHFKLDVLIGWLIMSLGSGWACWAFWIDKDVPAVSGNFKYEDGGNQFIRAVYVVALVLRIAQRGGFLGRKRDGKPGVKTIWLELQEVAIFVEGARYARQMGAAGSCV